MSGSDVDTALYDRAVAGDHLAFASMVDAHRRAIFRQCYQMLGSGVDAEDASQDTLERGWRRLGTFDGSGSFGAWLHRIATNVCLDVLRKRRARLDPTGEGPAASPRSFKPDIDPESQWVEPVSDTDLGDLGDPGDQIIRREDVSLAFVAALQRLAPRQRAALLLVDVLGFSQAEVAEVLEMSQSAVNSLLSRAREAARARPSAPRIDPSDRRMQAFLDRYVEAWRLADINAFVLLITEDVRLSMPPMMVWFEGRESVAGFVEDAIFSSARPHGIPLRARWCNGQPAFGIYEPDDTGRLMASGLQVLEIVEANGRLEIQAIVSFRDAQLAIRCGLPPALG
jgi:RNA polymerase sigma-70 factor, ECF subfamily